MKNIDKYIATEKKKLSKLKKAAEALNKVAVNADQAADRAYDRFDSARRKAANKVANAKGIANDEAERLLGL